MTTKKKTPPRLTPEPRKNYIDPVDIISGMAGGFMAGAMNRMSSNIFNWQKALFSFSIYPSGKVKLEGKWVEWLKDHLLDFGWLVKLVSPPKGFAAHNPAFDIGAMRLDVNQQGRASISREYDARAKYPDIITCTCRQQPKLCQGAYHECICDHSSAAHYAHGCSICSCRADTATADNMRVERIKRQYRVEPQCTCDHRPEMHADTYGGCMVSKCPCMANYRTATEQDRWGKTRFCFCPKKHDNAAHDKFCAWCGGSLEPVKPTDSDGRRLPHPMAWYCQHIKPDKPYMICVAKKGHKDKHCNGSFTWENNQ